MEPSPQSTSRATLAGTHRRGARDGDHENRHDTVSSPVVVRSPFAIAAADRIEPTTIALRHVTWPVQTALSHGRKRGRRCHSLTLSRSTHAIGRTAA
jgi:hypothetical protein